jgi:hypothetical protein
MMRTNVVRVGEVEIGWHELYCATRLTYFSPYAPRRVSLGMAQAPVNAQDDGEKVTPDLKLVVKEETMKVLEGVQLKVILYV